MRQGSHGPKNGSLRRSQSCCETNRTILSLGSSTSSLFPLSNLLTCRVSMVKGSMRRQETERRGPSSSNSGLIPSLMFLGHLSSGRAIATLLSKAAAGLGIICRRGFQLSLRRLLIVRTKSQQLGPPSLPSIANVP